MALDTVTQYIAEARILLQDQGVPYRYPDLDLVAGLNMAMMEARRLRPDLFLSLPTLPSFSANDSTVVSMDPQYRPAFVYYIVGNAQLRDDENTQDQRAAALLNKFTSQLTAVA